MTIIANPVTSRLAYACSACPACSCASRNAAQEAVAAAVEAARASTATDEVHLGLAEAIARANASAERQTRREATYIRTCGVSDCTETGPHIHAPGIRGVGGPSPGACACGVGRVGDVTAYAKGASLVHGASGCLKTDGGHEKTFTRAEVLAVLKSRKASVQDVGVWAEHDKLITIFERME
jgi:hypothetical protein